MDEIKRRVLGMFEQMGKEALDLHELFEAGGNDADARLAAHSLRWHTRDDALGGAL